MIRVWNPLYLAAIRDTVERFEATGSPVITDGEQRKYHNCLDISGPWPDERASGGLPYTACGRAHAPDAATDRRAVPVTSLQEQANSRH